MNGIQFSGRVSRQTGQDYPLAWLPHLHGNLNVESLQDTSNYVSKQQSLGGSVTVGYGFSGSVNASKSNINSNYAAVTEQSGIKAGDKGYQVNVKGNTDLKGAVIESTGKAVQDGSNSLTTASLISSDIQNKASYSGESIGLGVGYSTDGKGVGKDSQGQGAYPKFCVFGMAGFQPSVVALS